MRDSLELETTPTEEACVQVSRDADYMPAMREEARRFRALLAQAYPPPPGCRIVTKSAGHDFGPYLYTSLVFDSEDEIGTAWAYHIEGNTPRTWPELEALAANPQPIPAPSLED